MIWNKIKLWRFPSAQVIFDDDPAPKEHSLQLQNEEMSNALIKLVKLLNHVTKF